MDKIKEYSDMGYEKLEVIKNVLEQAPKGTFLEVGTRRGGTALMALQSDNCDFLICVDPYLSFPDMNGNPIEMFQDWFNEANQILTETGKPYLFFKGTSDEYIKSHPAENRVYSYILLDGAHVDDIVQREIDYFKPRMVKGGVILVDNTDWLHLDFSEWARPRYDMAYFINL